MSITFSAVGLVSADLASSLAFYRRLGLDVPTDATDQPHVELALPGGVRIMWDTAETVASFTPGWTPPSGTPRAALAFECGSPAEVDAAYASLPDTDREGSLPPWDAEWGQRYATVYDPDGNPVDLFAPLPADPGQ